MPVHGGAQAGSVTHDVVTTPYSGGDVPPAVR
jgi:hypothetical protein